MNPERTWRISSLWAQVHGLFVLFLLLGLAFLAQLLLAHLYPPDNGPVSPMRIPIWTDWALGASGPHALLERLELWRLFTAIFLHGGIVHFLLNIWALYQLGKLIERIFGDPILLLTFLAGGVLGYVCSAGWHVIRGEPGITVGASGGVCALLALSWRAMRWQGDEISQAIGRQILGIAILNLVFGLTQPNINNAAHLGGFAAGLLVAYWLRPGRSRLPREARVRFAVRAGLWLSVVAVACLVYGFSGAVERARWVRAQAEFSGGLQSLAEAVVRENPSHAIAALRDLEGATRARDFEPLREQVLRDLGGLSSFKKEASSAAEKTSSRPFDDLFTVGADVKILKRAALLFATHVSGTAPDIARLAAGPMFQEDE